MNELMNASITSVWCPPSPGTLCVCVCVIERRGGNIRANGKDAELRRAVSDSGRHGAIQTSHAVPPQTVCRTGPTRTGPAATTTWGRSGAPPTATPAAAGWWSGAPRKTTETAAGLPSTRAAVAAEVVEAPPRSRRRQRQRRPGHTCLSVPSGPMLVSCLNRRGWMVSPWGCEKRIRRLGSPSPLGPLVDRGSGGSLVGAARGLLGRFRAPLKLLWSPLWGLCGGGF